MERESPVKLEAMVKASVATWRARGGRVVNISRADMRPLPWVYGGTIRLLPTRVPAKNSSAVNGHVTGAVECGADAPPTSQCWVGNRCRIKRAIDWRECGASLVCARINDEHCVLQRADQAGCSKRKGSHIERRDTRY